MASSGGKQDPLGGSEAKRVLIIDDHEVARDGLRGLVETCVPVPGAGIEEATTYEDAVERLGSGEVRKPIGRTALVSQLFDLGLHA